MKNIKNFILTLASGILFLSSCTEKINLSIPNAEPILVVESEVTTETDSSYVRLTLSSNYFDATSYPVVKSANVSVNGVSFNFDPTKNLYKPAAGYVGKKDSSYYLLINYDGKNYSAFAKLERMFRVDSFFQTYKEAQGFFPAGYSVSYVGFDDRPKIKYTYFVNGKYDTIAHKDSFDGNRILFNSDQTPINQTYNFEIPLARFKSGEEYIYIFRSVDKPMNDFIDAYNNQSSGAPGPFQVPPANLPTNITGGALGYFATYDVVRGRYKIK